MGTGTSWRDYAGKHVTVHVMEGGYAARLAPSLLRETDSAADMLESLAGSGRHHHHDERVNIYLVDPITDLLRDGAFSHEHRHGHGGIGSSDNGDVLVRTVEPELSGDAPIVSLTRLMVHRWFGQDAVSATPLVDGLAGLVAARTGASPSIQEADDWVREGLSSGRPVSPLRAERSGAIESSASLAEPPVNLAATSFVAFLVGAHGPDAFRQCLANYDPDRPDASALAAFHRPLAALEETWLAGLRRTAGDRTTFAGFLRQLAPLLRPHVRQAPEILVYVLFGLTYSIVLPLSSKYLVDQLLPGGSVPALAIFVIALFLMYVLHALVWFRKTLVTGSITQRVMIELQVRMFTHLQHLPHSFYGRAKGGDIISRFSGDLYPIQLALDQIMGTAFGMVFNASAAAITLLVLDFRLGALVLIVLPLFALLYRTLQSHSRSITEARLKLIGELLAILQENLLAHAAMKAFRMEGRAIAAYRGRMTRMQQLGVRATLFWGLFDASNSLALTFGVLLVLGAGGYLAMQGQVTVGTLLAVIGLLPSLFQPVATLAMIGRTIQNASAAMDRVTELLGEPVTLADAADAATLPSLSRELRLEHVSFSYGGDRPVLRDLNLTLPAGAHTAIVGPSGSGKSSVVNLLLRFWDPEQGRVLLDGHDIRQGTVASLRGQIGVVFQDTFVFDTTLRENIALARPGASEQEIAAAARAAQLEGLIASLPAGYDTVLGERGVRMSGGQRQRLALARVLLQDPRILILDEATSALDAQTERGILNTLAEVTQGRTTISITHRLALAEMADTVVVLDDGQIVEQGHHAELVKSGGRYQGLYEEQMNVPTSRGALRLGLDLARLQEVSLFAGLAKETLTALVERLILERYAAGEEVVRQGESGDKLYLIGRGQVEVVSSDAERERRLTLLNEGEYFGEMALLLDQPRAATVRTTMPSELLGLTRSDFVDLLEREPEIRQRLAENLALRRTTPAQDDVATVEPARSLSTLSGAG